MTPADALRDRPIEALYRAQAEAYPRSLAGEPMAHGVLVAVRAEIARQHAPSDARRVA